MPHLAAEGSSDQPQLSFAGWGAKVELKIRVIAPDSEMPKHRSHGLARQPLGLRHARLSLSGRSRILCPERLLALGGVEPDHHVVRPVLVVHEHSLAMVG